MFCMYMFTGHHYFDRHGFYFIFHFSSRATSIRMLSDYYFLVKQLVAE